MSLDTERAIIGSLLEPSLVDDIIAGTREEYFSAHIHAVIFRAVLAVIDLGATPDLVTVSKEAKRQGEDIKDHLLDCHEHFLYASQLPHYLKMLQDEYRKREGIKLAREILTEEGATGAEIDEKVSKHLETIDTQSEIVPARKIVLGVMREFEERTKRRGQITGISTGFVRMDRATSGLVNGNLIVLAARPSIGKTAAAMNIVEHATVRLGIPGLFFSLEMTKEELLQRLILSMAGVPSEVSKTGEFNDEEMANMDKMADKIHKAPFYIQDRCGLTMIQIRAMARAAKRKHDIRYMVIDYLGLVDGKGTEYERVTEASRACKKMAKDLCIPVIAVHQLNRGSENRAEKRPTMSDLRSSGQIEQDADIIILLHREKKEPEEEAEIIMEKNRNGATGIIKALWHGPFSRYTEQSY